jgi:hypothetical protein
MRPLRREEHVILERLLELVPSNARPSSDYKLLAEDMKDGGMGSIRFTDESGQLRKMGRELVTAEYIDEDRIPVSISINLDEEGRFFELDFWKVNFEPLRRYPRPEEVHSAPSPNASRG